MTNLKIQSWIFDAMVLAGFLAFEYGLWLLSHAMAYLIGGLVVAASGILMGRTGDEQRRRP